MIARRLARPLSARASAPLSSSWTCPACRQQTRSLILPSQPQTSLTKTLARSSTPQIQQQQPQQQHRTYAFDYSQQPHERAEDSTLAQEKSFQQHGVPGLLSPEGFQIAWTQYQGMMKSKLRELVAGETYEQQTPKSILLETARDPLAASLFNHASMVFNNHFFFSTLALSPRKLEDQASLQPLRTSLEKTYGSIETLRDTMIATASAMFGPGFVWLVWAEDVPSKDEQQGPGGAAAAARGSSFGDRGDWRILTTYLAGTPYPQAGYRLQDRDMSTAANPTLTTARPTGEESSLHNPTPRMLPPGASRVHPVMCVNTWEHVYIYDYTLAGKMPFLHDWWDAIDWEIVRGNAHFALMRQDRAAGGRGLAKAYMA